MYKGSLDVSEEAAERTGKGATEVGVEAVERVLPEIGNLIPRVEHVVVLVCPGEGQLYAYVAGCGASVAPAAGALDGAVGVVEARERASGARAAPELLPEQVLQSPLLEFKNLIHPIITKQFKILNSSKVLDHFFTSDEKMYHGEASDDVVGISDEYREGSSRVLSSGEGHHVTSQFALL